MRVVCLSVFFASGFSALLYQVIWQRLLSIFSGADVYSATIIVAAFLSGLGIGSLAGGHAADRVSSRTSLVLFGMAEIAVAVFALASAPLYSTVLYMRMGQAELSPAAMGAVLFASLLWPTFFMGCSLPLLARALTRRVEAAAPTVGLLYGLNTLGAALGALLGTWGLVPWLGLAGSLRVGALINAACAAVVLPFAMRSGREHRPAPAEGGREPKPPNEGVTFPVWAWAAIYGVSGLLALALEIVWFRALGVMVKSTAFTFGTLLAVYLGGLGAGSVVGSRLAPRAARPGVAFLMLQAAVGLCAGGLLAVFVAFADEARALRGYFGSYEPIDVAASVAALRAALSGLIGAGAAAAELPGDFLRLYVLVPIVLVVPPTLLMGCSFPLLQRVVQTDLPSVGRRVGLLLVANIVGSVLGAMAAGWLLLDVLGTPGTFRVLIAASGVFALMALLLAHRQATVGARMPRRVYAAAAAALVLTAGTPAALPGARSFWATLHGTTPEHLLVGEDGSGLSVIRAEQSGGVVFVNGLGQSTFPYGGIHTALGAVPAFVHPAPRAAAVIGLGSGDTLHAVAGRPDLERITCIEIIRPQLDTLRQLFQRWPYRGLGSVLHDPRIEHVFGDGRIHLMRGRRTYDLIEADALRPGSAYAGNLYSEEYFRIVRDHLKPNGLAATWVPTPRVLRTFLRVFPYAVSVPGMLIGSTAPIVIDRAAIAARAADARVRRHFAAAGIDIERLLDESLAAPVVLAPGENRGDLTDVNTDLFPRDEFNLTTP